MLDKNNSRTKDFELEKKAGGEETNKKVKPKLGTQERYLEDRIESTCTGGNYQESRIFLGSPRKHN